MKSVTIIGGGLAGLLSAIQISRAGIGVVLFEKKKYPFHRVCGEYISNETIPFLKSLDLYPEELGPAQITRFQLTSVNGKSAEMPLDLGGFGLSRYSLDHWLMQKAQIAGVKVMDNTEVVEVKFAKDHFSIKTNDQSNQSDVVIGAFGKRSKMDIALNRPFIQKRSPYIGVKYHIRYNFPADLIALHNFKDGYCGISRVENDLVNLCYLSHRRNLKVHGDIKTMEQKILFENPFLKEIFQNANFVMKQPETINEISFETKSPVEDHILMCGDAAGMITPLCGNGMAMAIHASKILSELVVPFCKGQSTRSSLENDYTNLWHRQFANRLWAGRQIQKLFGSVKASDFSVLVARKVKPFARYLMSKTHGAPFQD